MSVDEAHELDAVGIGAWRRSRGTRCGDRFWGPPSKGNRECVHVVTVDSGPCIQSLCRFALGCHRRRKSACIRLVHLVVNSGRCGRVCRA